MNIQDLKPGKELDKLVAEHIFGGRRSFKCPHCESTHFDTHIMGSIESRVCHKCSWDDLFEDALPHYSTNIADAWLVVEKLQKLSPVYREDSYEWFYIDAPNKTETEWQVGWKAHLDYEGDYLYYTATGNTVMEAICKAALERIING